MSVHPDGLQFALSHTRDSMENEAERLATLLAETERDLARLLAILDWMDGDNDNEPSLGAPALSIGWAEKYDQTAWATGGRDDREAEDDAEPSLGAPERYRSWGGNGLDRTCAQIAWGAGGDADIEVVGRMTVSFPRQSVEGQSSRLLSKGPSLLSDDVPIPATRRSAFPEWVHEDSQSGPPTRL